MACGHLIVSNFWVDVMYIANENDLEETGLYINLFSTEKKYILEGKKEAKERGKKRGREKRNKAFLLFHPESKILEPSGKIFLTHVYIHKSCPKILSK